MANLKNDNLLLKDFWEKCLSLQTQGAAKHSYK